MKKPQLMIGLLAALGTAIGLFVAIVGLPYGRMSYTAFAALYHGTTNEQGKLYMTLDCDTSTAATDLVCNIPAGGVASPRDVLVTLGNNGPATSLSAMNFDVLTPNKPVLAPLPNVDGNRNGNPDLFDANFPNTVTFNCSLPAPQPELPPINPATAGSRLVCFTGANDGPALPTSIVNFQLATVHYTMTPPVVAGSVVLTIANVSLTDNAFNEIGSCNATISVAIDCFSTTFNFFVPTATPTATNTLIPTATNTPTNTATATNTSTPTLTPTPNPAPAVVKSPEGNANNTGPGPSANLWLCTTSTATPTPSLCAGPGEGHLRVFENATNVHQDYNADGIVDVPDMGLGAYEFQVEYDNFVIQSVNPCDVVFSPGGAGAARGYVDQLNSSAINPNCAGDPGLANNGTCAMSFVLENLIRFGCVTRGQVAGPVTSAVPMTIASLYLVPHPDLKNDIFPGNNNGTITILKDNGCELVDIFGHPVLGSINGGLTPICGDLAVTVRILEGDLNLDCKVSVTDEQAIATRYGGFFGSLLYNKWYDLEPATHDLDIDIKDLQKVFGRDGSTCQNPIPAQLPENPPAPFAPLLIRQ